MDTRTQKESTADDRRQSATFGANDPRERPHQDHLRPVGHRSAARVVDANRATRLTALAERLDRTLAHQLIDLAPLAWNGDGASSAVEQLRRCLLELRIAGAGLRRTAAFGVEPTSHWQHDGGVP